MNSYLNKYGRRGGLVRTATRLRAGRTCIRIPVGARLSLLQTQRPDHDEHPPSSAEVVWQWRHTDTPPSYLHGLYGTSPLCLNQHSMMRCCLISCGWNMEQCNGPSSENSLSSRAAALSSAKVKSKAVRVQGMKPCGEWRSSSIHS